MIDVYALQRWWSLMAFSAFQKTGHGQSKQDEGHVTQRNIHQGQTLPDCASYTCESKALQVLAIVVCSSVFLCDAGDYVPVRFPVQNTVCLFIVFKCLYCFIPSFNLRSFCIWSDGNLVQLAVLPCSGAHLCAGWPRCHQLRSVSAMFEEAPQPHTMSSWLRPASQGPCHSDRHPRQRRVIRAWIDQIQSSHWQHVVIQTSSNI